MSTATHSSTTALKFFKEQQMCCPEDVLQLWQIFVLSEGVVIRCMFLPPLQRLLYLPFLPGASDGNAGEFLILSQDVGGFGLESVSIEQ